MSYDNFHLSNLVVPISQIFSLVFDWEDGGSSFLKTSNSCFLRPKTIKLDVLRKKPAGSIPGGFGQRVFDWNIV